MACRHGEGLGAAARQGHWAIRSTSAPTWRQAGDGRCRSRVSCTKREAEQAAQAVLKACHRGSRHQPKPSHGRSTRRWLQMQQPRVTSCHDAPQLGDGGQPDQEWARVGQAAVADAAAWRTPNWTLWSALGARTERWPADPLRRPRCGCRGSPSETATTWLREARRRAGSGPQSVLPSRRPGSTRTEPGTSSGTSAGSYLRELAPGQERCELQNFPRGRVPRPGRLRRMVRRLLADPISRSQRAFWHLVLSGPDAARQRASVPGLGERRRPPLVDEGHGSPRRCRRSADARTRCSTTPIRGVQLEACHRPCL